MKKTLMYIFAFGLMVLLIGCTTTEHTHEFIKGICECGIKDQNYKPPHIHEFIEGICECGVKDSNYKPPHIHEYIEGICECGIKDQNYKPPHIHEFIEGICECGVNVYEYIIDIYMNEYPNELFTKEDCEIINYFGEYNNCQVAIIKGDYNIIMKKTVIIEDIVFIYKLERISVYINNKYYLLEEAYDLNMINYEQVLEIYNLYQYFVKQ